MSNITYYTEEGLQSLKEEVLHLKKVERPKISNQIAEARDKGDLSQNAEYDAAKEAQGLLEMKISKLETLISNARLVDESQVDTSKVFILSTVTIKNAANGQDRHDIRHPLVFQAVSLLVLGIVDPMLRVNPIHERYHEWKIWQPFYQR